MVRSFDGFVRRFDEGRRHGGYAAHTLREVQRHTFRREQVTHRAFDFGKRLSSFETFAIPDGGEHTNRRVLRDERRFEHRDAAHYTFLSGHESCGAVGFGGNGGFAGDVTVGCIFLKRGFDGRANDLTGQHLWSFPLSLVAQQL